MEVTILPTSVISFGDTVRTVDKFQGIFVGSDIIGNSYVVNGELFSVWMSLFEQRAIDLFYVAKFASYCVDNNKSKEHVARVFEKDLIWAKGVLFEMWIQE